MYGMRTGCVRVVYGTFRRSAPVSHCDHDAKSPIKMGARVLQLIKTPAPCGTDTKQNGRSAHRRPILLHQDHLAGYAGRQITAVLSHCGLRCAIHLRSFGAEILRSIRSRQGGRSYLPKVSRSWRAEWCPPEPRRCQLE